MSRSSFDRCETPYTSCTFITRRNTINRSDNITFFSSCLPLKLIGDDNRALIRTCSQRAKSSTKNYRITTRILKYDNVESIAMKNKSSVRNIPVAKSSDGQSRRVRAKIKIKLKNQKIKTVFGVRYKRRRSGGNVTGIRSGLTRNCFSILSVSHVTSVRAVREIIGPRKS